MLIIYKLDFKYKVNYNSYKKNYNKFTLYYLKNISNI